MQAICTCDTTQNNRHTTGVTLVPLFVSTALCYPYVRYANGSSGYLAHQKCLCCCRFRVPILISFVFSGSIAAHPMLGSRGVGVRGGVHPRQFVSSSQG